MIKGCTKYVTSITDLLFKRVDMNLFIISVKISKNEKGFLNIVHGLVLFLYFSSWILKLRCFHKLKYGLF